MKLLTYSFISVLWLVLMVSCSANKAAPGQSSSVSSISPFAVLMPKQMDTSYVYMILKNLRDEPITLVGVNSTYAGQTTLRKSAFNQDSNSGEESGGILIPANGMVELGPKGYFIMLKNLGENIRVGQNINIMLEFDNEETLSVNAVVQNSRYNGFRL